ncbi:ANR family transcriptional regulator [Pantoea agglomerans]|uniref:ANR family transcriptional regulator n=1 Tax=Enterobacter agglomerans TaxID=549 RepID=UPI003DA03A30
MNQCTHSRKRLRNPRFFTAAEAAAFNEKNGKFDEAGKLWLRAKKLAKNPMNIEWAGNRNQYCIRALHNGWSHIKGSD